MINNKLLDLKKSIEDKIDLEKSYIDRKSEVHLIKLTRILGRIEGYLMYKDYHTTKIIYETGKVNNFKNYKRND